MYLGFFAQAENSPLLRQDMATDLLAGKRVKLLVAAAPTKKRMPHEDLGIDPEDFVILGYQIDDYPNQPVLPLS